MKLKQKAEDKKIVDHNGYWYINKNPISKVGVFPYMGYQISPKLEPNSIYYVYRPAEELFKQDTMDSFKLVPFTDEHAMLGAKEEGLTPAEKKGIHGTTGEEIEHDEDTLYANIKVFSEELKKEIEEGKKEISLGYYVDYDLTPGEYNGIHYDAIQRNIKGNHMALVKEGRMGSDVRVMDSMDLIINNNLKKEMVDKRKDISEVEAMLYEAKKDPAKLNDEFIRTILQKMENNSYEPSETSKTDDAKDDNVNFAEGVKYGEELEKREPKKLDSEHESEGIKKFEEKKDESIQAKKEETEDGCDEEEKKSVSMDEMLNIIAERDELYNNVKSYTGEFDYKRKNVEQIAKYACDCLGLKASKGEEKAMLKGYLLANKRNQQKYGMDEKINFQPKEDKAFADYLK